MPGFVTHVHHNLASVFQVVHIALKLCEIRVGEIEGDADHGLARGTPPFIGEITMGTELVDALGFQFAIELLDESFERGTLEFESEFTNGLGEDLLEFGSGFLKMAHWAIQSSILRNQIWHSWRIGYAHSIVARLVLECPLLSATLAANAARPWLGSPDRATELKISGHAALWTSLP